jgi:hypothetical protein
LTEITRDIVVGVLKKQHPTSMVQLKHILEEDGVRYNDDALRIIVRDLENHGIITLRELPENTSLARFALDWSILWSTYLIVGVAIVQTLIVNYYSDNFLLTLVRLIFGLLLLGYFPGLVTVEIIFAKHRLALLDQTILSILLSVVISIGIGVVLGAMYLFTATNVTIVVSAYTIVASMNAIYSKFHSLPNIQ